MASVCIGTVIKVKILLSYIPKLVTPNLVMQLKKKMFFLQKKLGFQKNTQFVLNAHLKEITC